MTDFVIVIAAASALMSAAPASAPSTTAPTVTAAAATVATDAPTVGFRIYSDLASCEQATAGLAIPPGSRLICLPVEPLVGEMASAY